MPGSCTLSLLRSQKTFCKRHTTYFLPSFPLSSDAKATDLWSVSLSSSNLRHACLEYINVGKRGKTAIKYRVTHMVANLGWVELDLGSSPGWWPLL